LFLIIDRLFSVHLLNINSDINSNYYYNEFTSIKLKNNKDFSDEEESKPKRGAIFLSAPGPKCPGGSGTDEGRSTNIILIVAFDNNKNASYTSIVLHR